MRKSRQPLRTIVLFFALGHRTGRCIFHCESSTDLSHDEEGVLVADKTVGSRVADHVLVPVLPAINGSGRVFSEIA